MTGPYGSPLYMAPEKCQMKYANKIDIWALGVLFYEMILGEIPDHIDPRYEFPDRIEFSKFTKEHGDILKYILRRNPGERPTAEEILHRISRM